MREAQDVRNEILKIPKIPKILILTNARRLANQASRPKSSANRERQIPSPFLLAPVIPAKAGIQTPANQARPKPSPNGSRQIPSPLMGLQG